jgi:hypothetical protein
MSLENNTHVKKMLTTLELDSDAVVERVTQVVTDLHLDATDKMFNKAAVELLIKDCEEYMQSPEFERRISISGV